MSWSLGEARSLSVKAARGARLPWGLAEEAGFAVEWLESYSAPGVEALALYLEANHQYDPTSQSCPITRGASLADFGNWSGCFPQEFYQPLILVPFLAAIAGSQSIELSWAEERVIFNAEGISSGLSSTVTTPGSHQCTIRTDVVSTPSANQSGRVGDDRKTYIQMLHKHAHRTYAPATEASRARGAGAGLTDND